MCSARADARKKRWMLKSLEECAAGRRTQVASETAKQSVWWLELRSVAQAAYHKRKTGTARTFGCNSNFQAWLPGQPIWLSVLSVPSTVARAGLDGGDSEHVYCVSGTLGECYEWLCCVCDLQSVIVTRESSTVEAKQKVSKDTKIQTKVNKAEQV